MKSFLIVVVMIVLFVLAVRFIAKNGGWQGGCSGNCSSCASHCDDPAQTKKNRNQ